MPFGSATSLRIVAGWRCTVVGAPTRKSASSGHSDHHDPSAILLRQAAAAGAPIVEKPLLGNALIDGIRGALAGGMLRPS
jgi:hypothetical protein